MELTAQVRRTGWLVPLTQSIAVIGCHSLCGTEAIAPITVAAMDSPSTTGTLTGILPVYSHTHT